MDLISMLFLVVGTGIVGAAMASAAYLFQVRNGEIAPHNVHPGPLSALERAEATGSRSTAHGHI